jgi:hypothetical protein
MNLRFKDDQKHWYQFANYFIVECPRCHGEAIIAPKINWTSEEFLSAKRRLVCKKCSYFDETLPESGVTMHIDKDWFFELPLYLQAPCCGNKLVAYNLEHLEYINDFVQGNLREREKDEKWGWSNQSIASRLPKWLKSSKNRIKIINVINRLKSKVRP